MPERRDRDVQALLDLQRELARGDLVEAAAGDDQALAAVRACAAISREARRAGRACPRSRACSRLVGGAGDRGQRQQRRDVADGVAPATCPPAACRASRSAPVSASGLAVIRIVRRVRGLHRRERGRGARPRARSRSARPRLRVERGLEGVAGAGVRAAPRRPSRRARWCRSRSTTTGLGLADQLRRLDRLGRAPGSAPRAPARPGSSPPWPTAGRRAARACRSWPSTVPSRWPFRQGHFDADEPSHFGALRRARPGRADARCAPSSRTRSAPRSPTAARRRARRLPASRVLAEALHVSRGVVSEAYAQIAAEGWIEIRRGAAPVVRAVPAAGIGPDGGPQPATTAGSDPAARGAARLRRRIGARGV